MNLTSLRPLQGEGKKIFIETYGCQMNFGDSEIVVSIMQEEGYFYTEKIEEADIILINTCSVRDNAEQRIWGRLSEMRRLRRKKPTLLVGIIGCMAERLKEQLLESGNGVDIVAGDRHLSYSRTDLRAIDRTALYAGQGILNTALTIVCNVLFL